ncbi:MAG: polysaccharide biosynthesis protein [Pseudomonadales bacterium]|nr:polysaccharide biosynthesis protein [Pseudomonadales bacterium]
MSDDRVGSMGDKVTKTGGVQQIRQMAEVELLSLQELEEKKIINPRTDNKGLINTFREIRTKLVQGSGKKNFVCMVTSVVHGGGASFIGLNLAAAFALDQSKTALIIDCNLYEPSIDKMFDIAPEYGLTDYLEDSTLSIDDIIYATGISRLRVIPAGSFREAGAEYFSSDRMMQFIRSVKERYSDRYIFIDAPPVGISAEGRILSEFCDYSVLVVPYGKVTNTQIEAGLDAIGKDKPIGLIFNN